MMKHLFERQNRWGHYGATWVLVGFAFLLPVALWAVSTIHLQNDVESWLPQHDPQARAFQWYRDVFPPQDSVLVSWDGNSLADPRLKRYQERLLGRPDENGQRFGGVPYVVGVIGPEEIVDRMVRGGVQRDDAVRHMTGILIGEGALKLRLHPDFARRTDEIEGALIQKLQSELGLAVRRDETRQFPAPVSSGESESLIPAEPYDFAIRWPAMHDQPEQLAEVQRIATQLRLPDGSTPIAEAFLNAGDPVALNVLLSQGHHGHTQEVMQAIREAAGDVGIPPETIRLGGRPVAGSELNKKVEQTAWNAEAPWWQLHRRSPVAVSMLVGLVLAFVLLRSIRLTLLVLMTTSVAVLLSVALVPLTNGTMNMVLVVMPSLLSVLTLSGAIHVANYWKHAAAHNPDTAVVQAYKMAWQPCVLASVTTVIGLMSLVTSPLRPVGDFGLYSAIGCLISLTVILYGLPALLLHWPCPRPDLREIDRPVWRQLGHRIVNYWKPISLVSIGLFVVCTLGLRFFRTETKVIRYFPDEARVVQDYDFLEDRLSGIVAAEVVIRFDKSVLEQLDFKERADVIRQVEDALRLHPEISGTLSLADFFDVHPLPANPSFFDRLSFRRTINEAEERIKSGSEGGSSAFFTVAKDPVTLDRAGGRRWQVQPGDELWRITAQVSVMSELNYADLVGDFEDPANTPGELNVIVQDVLSRTPGASHVVTGMVPLFLQTQEAVLSSLVISFAWAFVLIGFVMMVLLRGVFSGLISMIPNVLPVGVVFGLVSWGGMAVDIGTMITASVALGIAVDGTLHLLTWFRKGIVDGLSRRDAIVQALGHCGPALWQTSMVVGISLLMLYPTDLLLVSRFGWLMAALISAALLGDLILLPALLAGPLGMMIERTVWRDQRQEAEDSYQVTVAGNSAALAVSSPERNLTE